MPATLAVDDEMLDRMVAWRTRWERAEAANLALSLRCEALVRDNHALRRELAEATRIARAAQEGHLT